MVVSSKLFLILIVIITACSSIKQTLNDFQIEEMKVYADVQERGFTTAGALTHFDDLADQDSEKIEILFDNLQELEQIMKNAKKMKHFQRKLAGVLLFCELEYKGLERKSRVVICIGTESAGIMDLTNRKDFVVRNQADIKRLQEFKNKIQR